MNDVIIFFKDIRIFFPCEMQIVWLAEKILKARNICF
jgi:hypothetical protein